jgi:flagellar hook assembly protein FlgD
VTIIKLNGNLVNRVLERDGNGGAVWDGRDLNGNLVEPGVYLYRVKGTNEEGKEFESELDKFIVVP